MEDGLFEKICEIADQMWEMAPPEDVDVAALNLGGSQYSDPTALIVDADDRNTAWSWERTAELLIGSDIKPEDESEPKLESKIEFVKSDESAKLLESLSSILNLGVS